MTGNAPRPLWRRIGWMLLIWLGSALALGAVSLVIRVWLRT